MGIARATRYLRLVVTIELDRKLIIEIFSQRLLYQRC